MTGGSASGDKQLSVRDIYMQIQIIFILSSPILVLPYQFI